MGTFIRIEINEELCTPDWGARLAEICPVNIFSQVGGKIVADPENEDECTLCELCLEIYPTGAVTVHRLYRE
jgi:Fe-S-cluster-containing hydrogenase component 2